MEQRLTAAGGELLAGIRDGVATVTLQRPAALNALNLPMVRGLSAWLDAWEGDPAIRIVVLRGAGNRAFCAGGDIRAIREAHQAGNDVAERFFQEEYALDHRLHTYPKPIVSVMDGIVMGGGMGLSQGTALRIVGARTRMAMPETAIGLFPDVGGTWFLSRTPGHVGLWMGLVGTAIGGADALEAGLADAWFGPEALVALDGELVRAAARPDPRAALRDLAERLAGTPPAGDLPRLREAIDRHFGQSSVAAILASLAGETREALRPWARETLDLLALRSPTLLRVTFEQLRRGRGLALADCFRLELDLVHGCLAQGDVAEGIRALLVDKDKAPRWNPPALAEVTDESVARFFASRWSPQEHPLRNL